MKRKSFFEEYCRIIGLLLLGFMIILLFSTPSTLLAKTFTMVDTELSHASESALCVRAKLDFGNNEHMRAFPMMIGDWRGRKSDIDTNRLAASLGADVMLMRDYWHPKSRQPVFFLIMQSTNRSTFYPPLVCYPALGYAIEEEGKVGIPVQNLSWIEEPLYSKQINKTSLYSNLTLPPRSLSLQRNQKRAKRLPSGGSFCITT